MPKSTGPSTCVKYDVKHHPYSTLANKIKVPARADDLSLADRYTFDNTQYIADLLAMIITTLEDVKEELRKAKEVQDQPQNLNIQHQVPDLRTFMSYPPNYNPPHYRQVFDQPVVSKHGAFSSGDSPGGVRQVYEIPSPKPALPLSPAAEPQRKGGDVDVVRMSPHPQKGLFLPASSEGAHNPQAEVEEPRYEPPKHAIPFQKPSPTNVSQVQKMADPIAKGYARTRARI
ncbi:hypothetical protein F4803DRAFT_568851 [Xylaria telfairii]|nr:hypothetical protein F4803DRAFT_568851 [Xylaria telfairii]